MSQQLELPCTGVLVECRRAGRRLRVVPASPGYQPWHVAFPRGLRTDGHRYWVAGLRPVAGKYYRALRPIAPAQPIAHQVSE